MEHAHAESLCVHRVCPRLAAHGVRAHALGKGVPPPACGGLVDIHDLVPQLEEALGRERLGEEVGEFLVAADYERDA